MGYIKSIEAAYFIEVERWKEALESLVTAKLIYKNVSDFKDSLEAVIYQEKIGQFDTLIRLCCLKLNLKSSADTEALHSQSWSTNIKSAYSLVKTEKIENIQEITYNGKVIPLKSERLKTVFKRVEN